MRHLVFLFGTAIVLLDEYLRLGDYCASLLRKFAFGDRRSKLNLIEGLKADIARIDEMRVEEGLGLEQMHVIGTKFAKTGVECGDARG